jgi:hypothetical protein
VTDDAETVADLVRRHIDGVLDGEGRRRLEECLNRSAEARRVYVREMKLHAALWVDLKGVGRPAEPADAPVATRRRRARFPRDPRPGALPWTVFAAAGLFAVVLAVAHRGSGPAPAPLARRAEPAPLPAEPPPPNLEPAPAPGPAAPAPEAEAPPARLAPPRPAPPPPAPPVPEPAPAPAPIPIPIPAPAPRAPEAPTAVAAAVAERVHGPAERLRAGARSPLRAREGVAAEDGVETGVEASVLLTYPDGTRVTLSPGTLLARVADPGRGKVLRLSKGTLTVEAARQPADAPMILETPLAEARVLGTTLRLTVVPGERGSTRLDVTEGKVRLTRLADRKSVEVVAGHYAVAAAGVELAARPVPRTPLEGALAERGAVTVNFGPPGVKLPEGVLNDAAEEFDPARGYGWTGPADQRGAAQRAVPRGDVLRATHVWAGSKDRAALWTARVPNGTYLVGVCVGDDRDQGPHHVAVEGRLVIDTLLTRPDQYVESKEVPVVVRDGTLTVGVGGHQSPKAARSASGTRTADTTICWITLRRAP